MSNDISTNRIRKSVLLTTIFATVFIMIMLYLLKTGIISNDLQMSTREGNGLESPIILLQAVILTFIALLGTLIVIIKNRKS